MKKTLTYQEAFNELERIVEEIETGKIQLDVLSEKISRAAELIEFCRTRLRTVEDEFLKTREKLG